jgi:hypothetical protein
VHGVTGAGRGAPLRLDALLERAAGTTPGRAAVVFRGESRS